MLFSLIFLFYFIIFFTVKDESVEEAGRGHPAAGASIGEVFEKDGRRVDGTFSLPLSLRVLPEPEHAVVTDAADVH